MAQSSRRAKTELGHKDIHIGRRRILEHNLLQGRVCALGEKPSRALQALHQVLAGGRLGPVNDLEQALYRQTEVAAQGHAGP